MPRKYHHEDYEGDELIMQRWNSGNVTIVVGKNNGFPPKKPIAVIFTQEEFNNFRETVNNF